jgi:serine/threonine protein phosphatase 1
LIKHFHKNESGRDFVVGDIHGCFGQLQDELNILNFDAEKDRLFCVGDLVDRGPESEDVVKWLNKPWLHSVRGNHEQMAIETFRGDWDACNYFINGGQWFLGLTHEERAAYVDLFESMPLIIEVETSSGNIGIVHAEYPIGKWQDKSGFIADKSFQSALIWSRDRVSFGDQSLVNGIDWIYCGHTPVNERTVFGNHVYLDTGAVFDGSLTIIEI